MTTVFTLKNLVKYIIFIGIIYALMIIIPCHEISKINLILIVSIIYISFILLDCLNNNSESFSDTNVNTLVPLSPTIVNAIPGDGEAIVTWTVPINNGVNISSYIITNNLNTNILKVDTSSFLTSIVDASSFLPISSTPITTLPATTTSENGLIKTITAIVPGLINGTRYRFFVQSINTEGPSPVTSLHSSLNQSYVWTGLIQQTNVTAIAGNNGQATVTWTVPINNTRYPTTSYLITNNVDEYLYTLVDASSFLTVTVAPPDNEIPRPIPTSTAITTTVNGLTTITATVLGLINGTPYTFTVHPRYLSDLLPVKSVSISNSVTPIGQPPPPPTTNVNAIAGNSQASVTWTVPINNTNISSYHILNRRNRNRLIVDASSFLTTLVDGSSFLISSPSMTTLPATTSENGLIKTITAIVPGLINGTSYSFFVQSKNTEGLSQVPSRITGRSAQESISNLVVPIESIDLTNVTAIAGNGQVSVTWTVPTNNSSSNISSYLIINNVDISINTIVDASSFLTTTKRGVNIITPISTATRTTENGLTTITATVLGLINGTPYTFTVRPQNQAGISLATSVSTSNSVTPQPPLPLTTNVYAIAGDSQASVTWTVPINNTNISSYHIINSRNRNTLIVDASSFLTTLVDGSSFLISSPSMTTLPAITTSENGLIKTITAIVPGLINGTSYSFFVQSKNTESLSPVPSLITGQSAQESISNLVVPIESIDLTNVTAIAGNGQASVTWTVPTNNSSSNISSYLIINNVDISINTIVDASSFLTTTKRGVTIITPTSTATRTTENGLTTITATVLGLINGTPYTFTVHPRNQAGLSPATSAATSNSVTPTIENNIMLYVTILGGFIVGIFLLYLVIMLFSNNNPDKEEVQEEVEEEEVE